MRGRLTFFPDYWENFFREVDELLPLPVELRCIGGFVIMQFSSSRSTGDLDYLDIIPSPASDLLERIAGRGSELAKRHKLYIQRVGHGIATPPWNYEDRLMDLSQGRYRNLQLKALEIHDIVLLKVLRNDIADREDFKSVAHLLDLELLQTRFEEELIGNTIGQPSSHRLTLKLWIEALDEGI